jgi:hypothetical protein
MAPSLDRSSGRKFKSGIFFRLVGFLRRSGAAERDEVGVPLDVVVVLLQDVQAGINIAFVLGPAQKLRAVAETAVLEVAEGVAVLEGVAVVAVLEVSVVAVVKPELDSFPGSLATML